MEKVPLASVSVLKLRFFSHCHFTSSPYFREQAEISLKVTLLKYYKNRAKLRNVLRKFRRDPVVVFVKYGDENSALIKSGNLLTV